MDPAQPFFIVKDPIDGYIDWLGDPKLQEHARATVRRHRELEDTIVRMMQSASDDDPREVMRLAEEVRLTVVSRMHEWSLFMRCVRFYLERIIPSIRIVVPRAWIESEGPAGKAFDVQTIEELESYFRGDRG